MLDPDVVSAAKHFGIDPVLIQAVLKAEGNIVKAVSLSVPSILDLPLSDQRAKAIEITCRSAVHALSDWVKANGHQADFVAYWGARWAPIGVANDPHLMNAFWIPNVLAHWVNV